MKKTILHSLVFGLMLLLLLACGSSKQTPVVEENPRPGWVQQKPVSPEYYHGVGFAYKVPGREDHHEIARNNALNNLAGEVSVEISNQSILYQVESDRVVRENFRSNTTTSSRMLLEGYELVAVWESEREIWTFYRLSKRAYEDSRRKQREQAIANSMDRLQRAKENSTNPLRKLEYTLSALDALRNYLGDPIEVDYEGQRIFLANKILSDLRTEIDRISIKPVQGGQIRVKRGKTAGENNLQFQVNYGTTPYAQLPILMTYTGNFRSTQTVTAENFQARQGQLVYTNASGRVGLNDTPVHSRNAEEFVYARVDLQSIYRQTTQDPVIIQMLERIREPHSSIRIQVDRPLVFIQSEELNLDNRMDVRPLATAFERELSREGLQPVQTANGADYILRIDANTQKPDNSPGTEFITALLDARIEFLDSENNNLLFSHQISGQRGVQLNLEQAGRDAYRRAAVEIEQRIFSDLRRKVFP